MEGHKVSLSLLWSIVWFTHQLLHSGAPVFPLEKLAAQCQPTANPYTDVPVDLVDA